MTDRYIPGWGLQPDQTETILRSDTHILDDPKFIHNTGEGNVLCYIPHRQIWFYSSPYSVLGAEYNLNRKFIGDYAVAIGEFYRLLRLPKEMWSEDDEGWSQYIGETEYGYIWIDFIHYSGLTRSGKPVMIVEYACLPHHDYLEEPE